MAAAPADHGNWRKSSYSNGGTGDCVEIAFGSNGVGVRDSKNTDGPTLAFAPAVWRKFVQRTA